MWSRSFTFLSRHRSACRDDAGNGDGRADGMERLFYGAPTTGRHHAGGAGRMVTAGLGLERDVRMKKEEPFFSLLRSSTRFKATWGAAVAVLCAVGEVLPICADNLDEDSEDHFSVQHSHLLKTLRNGCN
ncbi:hypothetical protein GUJ93_ZPchr0001g32379 [Zizania palustris]|uniref:Uncharacterized protein n=1 Tax=Zizania palustris TaxID=103762 RepID=A0A8J5R6Y7_ZIZPA|nr:hypothetical protein GUJ93_ZPchr0001g32379 [Zizania palustris]